MTPLVVWVDKHSVDTTITLEVSGFALYWLCFVPPQSGAAQWLHSGSVNRIMFSCDLLACPFAGRWMNFTMTLRQGVNI